MPAHNWAVNELNDVAYRLDILNEHAYGARSWVTRNETVRLDNGRIASPPEELARKHWWWGS